MAWGALIGLATAGLGAYSANRQAKAAKLNATNPHGTGQPPFASGGSGGGGPAGSGPGTKTSGGGFWPTTAQGWLGLGSQALGAYQAGKNALQGSAAQGESGAEAGEWQNDYWNTISPNTTEWERMGSGTAGTGGSVANTREQTGSNEAIQARQFSQQYSIQALTAAAQVASQMGDKETQRNVLRELMPGIVSNPEGADQLELNQAEAHFKRANIEISDQQLQLDYNMRQEERISKWAELYMQAVQFDYTGAISQSRTTEDENQYTSQLEFRYADNADHSFRFYDEGTQMGKDSYSPSLSVLGSAIGMRTGRGVRIPMRFSKTRKTSGGTAADYDELQFERGSTLEGVKTRPLTKSLPGWGNIMLGGLLGATAGSSWWRSEEDQSKDGLERSTSNRYSEDYGTGLSQTQGSKTTNSMEINRFDYERWEYMAGNRNLPHEQRGLLGQMLSKIYAEAMHRLKGARPDRVSLNATMEDMKAIVGQAQQGAMQ